MSLLRRIEGGAGTPINPVPTATPGVTTNPSSRDEASQRRTPVGNHELSLDLKTRVQNKLIAELDIRADASNIALIRNRIQQLFDIVLDQEGILLTRVERQRLFEQVAADIVGFGPLEPLLADETVSEIMVNGPTHIYVERKGRLEKANVAFENDDHVRRIIDRIISPLGRRCDDNSPMVDARLPDGSRVNAIIPPLSLVGPVITIRKFSKTPLTIADLIHYGTLTPALAEFLKACVTARLNIIVAGGTGSGKTTLLNILSSFIPSDERIVTVEDAAELQLRQEHVITLETRKANIEGKGAVTIRDLVINCLRMRPDRIVVGECRGAEALDMLQAMNTGHDGSLTTAHANNPRDTLSRLETMVLMAGMDLPLRAIREQISSAIQLIVFEERFRDGARRISYVTEVQGMEGDVIVLSDIFVFEQTGVEDGKIVGKLRPTGIRPKFTKRLEEAGIFLPPSVFGVDMKSW
ncbi:MAG: CpaF family protein [Dehalococcoidia bacterium]|nr:CpaF family protein [Dehalococcoidia bacterium]